MAILNLLNILKGRKMPGSYKELVDVFTNASPQMTGALMAMIIAILRVIYDEKETSKIRILLESMICGGLSLTASSAIVALGWDMNWAIFVGGAIGYFGSATVRTYAYKFIHRKLGN